MIRKTLRAAKTLGVSYIRQHKGAGASAGWPDFEFLIPGGRALHIEFKATGAKPSTLQERRIKELRDLGYDVEVHDDPTEAANAIRAALDAACLPREGR